MTLISDNMSYQSPFKRFKSKKCNRLKFCGLFITQMASDRAENQLARYGAIHNTDPKSREHNREFIY